jgi:hypothetical protein
MPKSANRQIGVNKNKKSRLSKWLFFNFSKIFFLFLLEDNFFRQTPKRIKWQPEPHYFSQPFVKKSVYISKLK